MTELDRLEIRREELKKEIESATSWGAALGAKCEELRGVDRAILAEKQHTSTLAPPSSLSRYAYGHSDKKPGWTFWIGPAIMVVGLLIVWLTS